MGESSKAIEAGHILMLQHWMVEKKELSLRLTHQLQGKTSLAQGSSIWAYHTDGTPSS